MACYQLSTYNSIGDKSAGCLGARSAVDERFCVQYICAAPGEEWSPQLSILMEHYAKLPPEEEEINEHLRCSRTDIRYNQTDNIESKQALCCAKTVICHFALFYLFIWNFKSNEPSLCDLDINLKAVN